MVIPPKYILTPRISQLLQSIEASKAVIDSIPILPEIENNIRRRSTLKSSLFSARIEGNTLTLDNLPKISPKDNQKLEVMNILKALNWINQKKSVNISNHLIQKLHKTVLKGLVDKHDLGKFRTEAGAIFNQAGIAIYLPPRPSQVILLINKLVKFINSTEEQFIPVKTALAHFSFEKIHPFLDGNGRVGRLLIQAILQRDVYGMKGLLSLEEYLDNNKSKYYEVLEFSEKAVTKYVEFMLEAMAETAIKVKKEILQAKDSDIEPYLLPRRAEILNIIRELNMVSFNQIIRRFLPVNERTLRYDLKKLADAGLIRKRGITKGVYYEVTRP